MTLRHGVITSVILCLTAIPSVAQKASSRESAIALHTARAQEYLREHQNDLAISELRTVVALDPSNVDSLGNLGVLLFFRGDYASAAPQLRAALLINPDLWKIQALLGLAEHHTGDDKRAREDMASGFPHLQEEASRLEVGRTLIDAYTKSGDFDKAATVVNDLLATEPTNTSLLYTGYRLYSDLLDRATLSLALAAPDSAEIHVLMAREMARHGDEASAIANYRAALRIAPQFPGAHFDLGEMLYNSSDSTLRAQAESEFDAALKINPHEEKAELMLGKIAANHGDLKAAYEHDSRAVQMQPDDVDACTELAKVLISRHETEKARELLEHALQIEPSSYVAHLRLAAVDRADGRLEAAKQESAQFSKYKKMHDDLVKMFGELRLPSTQSTPATDEEANP